MEETINVERELIEQEIELVNELNEQEIELLNELIEQKVEVEPETMLININYNYLINKPRINDVELIDNKTFENLGLSDMTNNEIENLLN